MHDRPSVILRGIIYPPGPKEQIRRTRVLEVMELPRWGGSLYFRNARPEEAGHLKWLYEDAWNNRFTEPRPITISADQLRASIKNFPQGQIVGCVKPPKGKKATDVPVSMINVMLAAFDPANGFPGGYEQVTGGRTLSTSMNPSELFDIVERSGGTVLPVAFCVSIAVPKEHQGGSYAFQTLKYAVIFSEVNGLIPLPYSAPRGLANSMMKNPLLDIRDYLHMTAPIRRRQGADIQTVFLEYLARLGAISDRLCRAFGEHAILIRELFVRYQEMPADSVNGPRSETAFEIFRKKDADALASKYGRELTIEDFCIITGRPLLDPVIGMHVGNGARFIRDDSGGIIGVFPDSRPEDIAACGYNIILSYGYHPLLGHKFASPESSVF